MVAEFCPFCGKPVMAPDARFCSLCGKAYPWTNGPSAPTSTEAQSPYGYVPPTPLYAGAQASPLPIPQPTAGYAPVYITPAPVMGAPYMAQQGMPLQQPRATSPGRPVGAAFGFGALALVLGGLADVVLANSGTFIAKSFFDAAPAAPELYSFFGLVVCGLLYWFGLMRSLTKSRGRVLGELLAVVSIHWFLLELFPLTLLAVLRHGGVSLRVILIYGVLSALALLILGFFCFSFVLLAGTWRLAQAPGVRDISAGIYLAVFAAAYAPLLFLYLLIYLLLGDPLRFLHYSFPLVAGIELLVLIVQGSVMAWQRVKRTQVARVGVILVATPVSTPGVNQ